MDVLYVMLTGSMECKPQAVGTKGVYILYCHCTKGACTQVLKTTANSLMLRLSVVFDRGDTRVQLG